MSKCTRELLACRSRVNGDSACKLGSHPCLPWTMASCSHCPLPIKIPRVTQSASKSLLHQIGGWQCCCGTCLLSHKHMLPNYVFSSTPISKVSLHVGSLPSLPNLSLIDVKAQYKMLTRIPAWKMSPSPLIYHCPMSLRSMNPCVQVYMKLSPSVWSVLVREVENQFFYIKYTFKVNFIILLSLAYHSRK